MCNILNNYREAFEGPYKNEWMESIQAENIALYEREVFEVVHKPKGSHLGTSMLSRENLGKHIGEKPIRILFALAQAYKLHILQMNVDTAFLYASLNEDICGHLLGWKVSRETTV
jgi:hypothetical protein